jgi:hypothetical protein
LISPLRTTLFLFRSPFHPADQAFRPITSPLTRNR